MREFKLGEIVEVEDYEGVYVGKGKVVKLGKYTQVEMLEKQNIFSQTIRFDKDNYGVGHYDGYAKIKEKKEENEMEKQLQELMSYDERVITEEEYTYLEEHELVTNVESNGMSGQHVNKMWYTVTLVDESEIEVYA